MEPSWDFVAEEIYLAGRFRAGFNCDSDRLMHVTVVKASHGSLDGRREQHCLAFGRKLLQNGSKRGQETHIEHSIGLVENDGAGAGKIDQSPLQIVAEAAWGSKSQLRPRP